MTVVTFYVLSDAGPDAHLRQACRIAEDAASQELRIFVRVADEALAKRIDDLLWTFGDKSFLPHEIATSTSPSHDRVRILIGSGDAPAQYRDLLINLGGDAPAQLDSFQRVAEFVPADEERKRQARARFKAYRDSGIEPVTQNV